MTQCNFRNSCPAADDIALRQLCIAERDCRNGERNLLTSALTLLFTVLGVAVAAYGLLPSAADYDDLGGLAVAQAGSMPSPMRANTDYRPDNLPGSADYRHQLIGY